MITQPTIPADIKVKFVCGCGFKTPELCMAILHVEQTGHTIDAVGCIKPEQRRSSNA